MDQKLLEDFAAKAKIDVGDLRLMLGAAAREVIKTESEFADIWVESLNSDTVVIGIVDEIESGFDTRFVEFPYDLVSGVVTLDTAAGKEVLRTFEPVEEFEKSAQTGRFFAQIELTGKLAGDGRRVIEGSASVFGVEDRDGEKMQPGAFSKGLKTFMSSPAMLYNHGRDPEVGRNPIGAWKEVREDEHGLFVQGEVATGDKHADRIWNLVMQGALNALSVGGHFAKRGKNIVRWDLVEISVASVPSNAFANFHVIKETSFVPAAVLEAPALVGELEARGKTAPLSAMETLHAAATALTSVIERATSLIAEGKTAAAETLVQQELRPAMVFGQKALSEGEQSMDLTPEQEAAIATAVGKAMEGIGPTIGTAIAETLDKREEAAAEKQAADEKASVELVEHDKGIATEAAEKAIEGFKEALRKGNFVPAATLDLMTAGDKGGDGGDGGDKSVTAPMDVRAMLATGMHKYDRLSFEDGAYYFLAGKALFPHIEENDGHAWRPNQTLLRSMALKAAKAFEAGDLPGELGYTIHTKWADGDDDEGGGMPAGKEVIAPWAMKADELMGSDVSNAGIDWVPTLWTSQLWEKIRLTNEVVSFLQGAGNVIDMPSDPYITPIESTDPVVVLAPQTDDASELGTYPGATTGTVVGTANLTMTTSKLMVLVPFTRELEEDSILPVVPQLRRQTEEAMENAIENVLINGDTTIGSGTNINANDTTPDGNEKYLVADGLRHLGLVTTTADTLDIGTLTLAKIRNLRKLMGTNGKMGIRSGELMLICDGQSYFELLDLDEVVTADKFGPQATVKTGGLESIDAIRIHASEEMGITAADGTIDADTAGNNTKGQIVIFNRRQFRMGFRRRLVMSVERIPFADGGYLVASLRMTVKARDTEGVAVGYNITI